MRQDEFFLNSCFDLENSINYLSDNFQNEIQRENPTKRIKYDSEKPGNSDFCSENNAPLSGLDVNSLTVLRKTKNSGIEEIFLKEKTTIFVMDLKREEEKRLLSKHISKIRFFWRGTNVNYPYAFQKVKRIKIIAKDFGEGNKQASRSEKKENEGFFLEEDFSLKEINQNEKHFS